MVASLMVTWSAVAQDYFSVSGVVRDSRTSRPLDYVNVAVAGTPTGTVTNSDGYFNLKIDNRFAGCRIVVSRLGYLTQRIDAGSESRSGLVVDLASYSIQVDEVVVRGYDPRLVIETAVANIEKNYDDNPCRMTGFYREMVNKRGRCVNVSEAVIDIYKSSYRFDTSHDRVAVLKRRSLESGRVRDTISVKLQGGPTLPKVIDAVKEHSEFFSDERLNSYVFTMQQPAMIDHREQYVIDFAPAYQSVEGIQYCGRLYIDEQTMAFTRIEYSMDMTNPDKVTSAILVRKPAGLRFRPVAVENVVTYKEQDGVYRLNYILTTLSFKCDWRRKLFATSYAVISESVITDTDSLNATPIAVRDAFRSNQSLSDRVGDFADPDFWGAYNIIEPTESLENAIGKLKKTKQ